MSEMEDTKRFSSEPASYLTAPNYLTASNQKDLTTEKKEFDPSPEITSKAFPEYQYRQFNISEEERKNYPAPNGQFYTKTYDVDNAKIYDTFFEAMLEVNEEAKKRQQAPQKIRLPKLKKIERLLKKS